jgi:4-hydroxy-tetrahydrodipicolinate synthase
MEHKPEGVSIIASGHTSDDLDTQIYEANKFIDCGIDAYVFISNRFAKADESDDILLKNMEYVASGIQEIGLGVYECPYPYKRILTPYVLERMAQTGKFQFLKDTCCDIGMIKDKLKAVKGSDLKIYNANSATLLDSLKLGCAGFSGVMANFHPELYVELCKIYNENPEKAEMIQNFVGFFSVAECQCYPVNAKYYLSLEGLDINIDSRARSKAEFPENRMAEIRQMFELTKAFKNTLLR